MLPKKNSNSVFGLVFLVVNVSLQCKTQHFSSKKVTALTRPGNSRDISSIENARECVKRKLLKKIYSTEPNE